MSTTAKVTLTWDETNPGWRASTVLHKSGYAHDGTSVLTEMANRQVGHGFDPLPVIWQTLNACAHDLDCHPGRVQVTITVASEEIEEIIRRQPLRG